jgi:hypothetical protein
MFFRFGRRASLWNIYSLFLRGGKSCLVDMALLSSVLVRLRLKCDGTRAETRFRLPAKRTSLFKSGGTSVQSTTGSRGVRISGSNAGYTMSRDSVKGTGYPLHSPVSPSLPFSCVTVYHHISTALYNILTCICLRRRLFRVTLEISRTAPWYCNVTPGTLTAVWAWVAEWVGE